MTRLENNVFKRLFFQFNIVKREGIYECKICETSFDSKKEAWSHIDECLVMEEL